MDTKEHFRLHLHLSSMWISLKRSNRKVFHGTLHVQVVEESGLDDCGGKVYDNNNNYYAYFMYPHFPYTIR